MWNILRGLFKTKKERDLQALLPLVEKINQEFHSLQSLSDDELRQETYKLRQEVQATLRPLEEKIETLRLEAEKALQEGDIPKQEALHNQIEELVKERNIQIEKKLTELLPRAFAVVKETARRYTQNGSLVVEATEWDHEMAKRYSHIQIQEGKAIWPNVWEVRGHLLKWEMIHYDVQLMGGMVLHQGKIAEMATGEGKTLVATLPLYLNALAGLGVHVVTVNDYLAKRDCEWNGPILAFHGLRVDCIDYYEPHSPERKAAYEADVTYGTNNEFGFDYLRDNMVTAPDQIMQRGHHYVIVDEVDSVLIDEARTPLIISGPTPHSDDHLYLAHKPYVERLVQEQRKLVQDYFQKAKKLISENKISPKEGGLWLLRIHRCMPKYRPLLKFLAEPGIIPILEKAEAYYLQDNARKMPEVDAELLFVIDEKNNSVEFTDKGIEKISSYGEDKELFVLPDLATILSEVEGNESLSLAEKAKKKETLYRQYAEKAERLHAIQQLLRAYVLFEKDVDYVVMNGQVLIVDEHTGRILPGRRYSEGLHQAIEAKENVKVEATTQTYATITLQNYFRMYHKLAGMTGTAETEAKEFYDIYKLDVVVIPTHKPCIRVDQEDVVYKTKREKYQALIEEIKRIHAQKRPILVGTTSVEVSELLSRMLKLQGIPHNVLNAKYHQKEAEIVAQAGMQGAVTIATNMAGRGTDIKLGPGVAELGGLAVIGSERHEARRIDNQLRGRAGRQGDPGSSLFFVSLEDDLMRLFNSERLAKMMDFFKVKEGEVLQGKMVTRAITNAQKKVEENNYAIRKRLLEYDEVMNHQRKAIYTRRRNAIFGDRLSVDLYNMLVDTLYSIIQRYRKPEDLQALQYDCIRHLAWMPTLSPQDLEPYNPDKLVGIIVQEVLSFYKEKKARIAQVLYQAAEDLTKRFRQAQYLEVIFSDGGQMRLPIVVPIAEILRSQGRNVFAEVEKVVTLSVIDSLWITHLRQLDDLKHAVQTAVYQQKDPLVVYKFEAFNLFKDLLERMNTQILSTLHRLEIEGQQQEKQRRQALKSPDFSRMRAQHASQTPFAPEYELVTAASSPAAQAPPQHLSRRERRAMERKQKHRK